MKMNTSHSYDNTHSTPISIWAILALLSFVVGLVILILLTTAQQPENDNYAVQYRTDIYHHFTVYSDSVNGLLSVVEIDLDNTYATACDGWSPSDEDGHNCIIVGSEDINTIIAQSGLSDRYPNVKGE